MGRGIKNIKGQRFGRLLVLEFAYTKNGRAWWLCRCDCGVIKVVGGISLRNDNTTSCGCYKRERTSERSRVELTGKRFERLVVLEFAYTKSGRAYWRCLCDCGIVKIISGRNLRSNRTKSCGCLRREIASETLKGKKRPDLSGEKHPNYNPNLTDEEREITRNYPEYHEWRKAVYERDNYTCQCCGDSTGGNLCAHHLESYRDNLELRTLLENGVTLCEKCHRNFHHQFGRGNNNRKQFEKFFNAQEKLENILEIKYVGGD